MDLLPDDLIALAERVVRENRAIGRTVALAESCTGGLVAAALTEVPGSSAVLDRSIVAYSNTAKHELLGVPVDIMETFGAVSIACAWAMAQGVLARTRVDVSVAISGIAGPDGGSVQKPVGTVVFARAIKGEPEEDAVAEERRLTGKNRSEIRHQAALVALELLLP